MLENLLNASTVLQGENNINQEKDTAITATIATSYLGKNELYTLYI